ncbi:hypothetical protein G3I59_43850 [Amycolatopsis rubida]|uniref:Glutaconate CoA-transferase subunit B n=1 Tax=Amycolatopsis rubida TaxID=112413 RepID=A0ABX0C3J9_9PSEU|nr:MULTISPECIES: CoA-transferase [Amycolatopsis]MYW97377.1 hypothetical protein [Amycolatopsis rubida]NEC62362.1 hypothetical protein [Amycolatopsis rubida]
MATYEIHELMACRISEEMREEGERVTVLGSFTPLAYAAYMLAKLTHAPDAWLAGYNAIGMDPIELGFSGAEAAIYKTARGRWSFTESNQLVHIGTRGMIECVSSVQLGGDGAINLSVIGDYDRPKVRLPGGAGSPEVVQNYHTVVAYFSRHDRRTFVPRVDFATGRRTPVGAGAREKRGLLPGPVIAISPLAVLRKDADDEPFSLASVHPGVSVEEVVDNTGFELAVPDRVPVTRAPTEPQLRVLRERIDPFATARFDFLGGRERVAFLREILTREWDRARALVEAARS